MDANEINNIADEIIERLRAEGYDAFIGGYYDITPQVRAEIVHVLNEKFSLAKTPDIVSNSK